MTSRRPGLLAEIEQDVLNDAPLAGALRKCIVLGGRAGSVELREWATKELRGYRGDDDVPEFRKVAAPILANATTGNTFITGQQISPSMLPEFARSDVKESVALYNGVGEIEAMIKQAESGENKGSVHLSLPMATDLARLMDQESGNPYQHISALYWSVSASTLRGVIDQVRTTLAELVAEMRAGMAIDDDVPTESVADQAVNVAVHGHKSRVTVTSAQASGGSARVLTPSGDDQGFWTRWRRIGAFLVGLATILTGIITYLMWR